MHDLIERDEARKAMRDWIPITESQPNEGQKIIARTISARKVKDKAEFVKFVKNGTDYVCTVGDGTRIVTHWMPYNRNMRMDENG
jgi:hypothetical protein